MRLTWEKIRKSLGIPDKQVDAEFAADVGTLSPPEEALQDRIAWGDQSQQGPGAELKEELSAEGSRTETESSGGAIGSSTTLGDDPTGGYQSEPDDGVYVAPTPITGLQEVTVTYNGTLAKQGAGEVFLHYGFGPGDWPVVNDVPMQKVGDRFETSFEVPDGGQLQFCFRDSSDNWDNNNGRNWSFIIHDGDAVP